MGSEVQEKECEQWSTNEEEHTRNDRSVRGGEHHCTTQKHYSIWENKKAQQVRSEEIPREMYLKVFEQGSQLQGETHNDGRVLVWKEKEQGNVDGGEANKKSN